jgi:hypothetical protein
MITAILFLSGLKFDISNLDEKKGITLGIIEKAG